MDVFRLPGTGKEGKAYRERINVSLGDCSSSIVLRVWTFKLLPPRCELAADTLVPPQMTFRHYRPDFAPLPRPPPANTSAASALVPRPNASALPASTNTASQPASYAGTPYCACGQPTLLRPDGKGRARSRLSSSFATTSSSTSPSSRPTPTTDFATNLSTMAFFWTCSAGMQNEGRTCKHWQLLDMRKEGRGRWFVPPC